MELDQREAVSLSWHKGWIYSCGLTVYYVTMCWTSLFLDQEQ